MESNNKSKFYAFGTVILWASAFVCTKIALEHFSGTATGVLRYVVASAFFVILAVINKVGLPERNDVPLFFISGFFGFSLYMLFFNIGQYRLSSATASIVMATSPVITAFAASIAFKEKIKLLGWLAICIQFCGILILTLWNGVLSINTGILWVFGSALCISVYNLLQRIISRKYSALQSTAYSVFAGTLIMLIFLPSAIPQLIAASVKQWLNILLLGIFPSAIGFLLWNKALSIAPKTTEVTNFMFVTPFIATIFGFLLIRELPNNGTIIGGVVILVGLFLFQKANSSR